jgi:hemolysin activation/secretion protein
LPEQNLNSGTANITIVEARMGKISIENGNKTLRTPTDRARNTLTACQKQGDVFNLDCLQRGINLVNDIPGAAATVVLSPSATTGETDVIMKLMDKPILSGSVQLDNNGSRSTGDKRISGNLTLDNPTKRGDQIQIASAFTSDTNYMRFAYNLPVGYNGTRLGAHTSYLQYWLGKEFTSLAAAGEASVVGLDARHPLMRGSNGNLSIVGTFDNRGYFNSANGSVTSDKTSNVLSVGLTGDRIDALGGGGFSFAGLFVNTGKLDLSGNAADLTADKFTANKDGNFNKVTWNAGRLQKFNEKTNLWFFANGQFTNKNLDSSESFPLGGPSGVRAYPNMEGTGDEGWLMTAEVRRTLSPKLTLTGFYDHGHVLQHKISWAYWNIGNTVQPATVDLKGAGVSLSWTEAGNYTAKLIFARRLGENPTSVNGNDSDGSKVLNRIWLNYVKYF